MIEIKETSAADIQNVQRLWADGDVMRFVGFPDGLHETDESMRNWIGWILANRPDTNAYSILKMANTAGKQAII